MKLVGTLNHNIRDFGHHIHADSPAVTKFQQLVAQHRIHIPQYDPVITGHNLRLQRLKSIALIHTFYNVILILPCLELL